MSQSTPVAIRAADETIVTKMLIRSYALIGSMSYARPLRYCVAAAMPNPSTPMVTTDAAAHTIRSTWVATASFATARSGAGA